MVGLEELSNDPFLSFGILSFFFRGQKLAKLNFGVPNLSIWLASG